MRTKREPEKCPLLSRRGRHEKGATRPFQTPKGKSKWKNASRFAKTGCGSQRLLRCRSHPAGRGPNSSSLFPPQAAVVAVARKGLLAPFRPRRGSRNGKKLAASLNAFFSFLRFTASPKILCLRKAKTESECEKELCGHQKERKIIKNQFKKPR